ncbi:MAG: hypothetical protein IPJ88_11305 [Myxococcales bacterium]|nr:MAG: hypothetical protein IPJ88_11305 [Myxococcales bacterium]
MPQNTQNKKPLAISCGDPAGIGPMISLHAAKQLLTKQSCVLFGDGQQLHKLAQAMKVPHRTKASLSDLSTSDSTCIHIVDLARVSEECIEQRKASAEGGENNFCFSKQPLMPCATNTPEH